MLYRIAQADIDESSLAGWLVHGREKRLTGTRCDDRLAYGIISKGIEPLIR